MIYNAYAEQSEKIANIQFVSCGHIFAKTGREINRPNGRNDWLLFHIAKESETFYLDDIEIGEAGSFIIFAPGEKQHHIYLGEKTAEFYYIHFQCEQLPTDISLSSSKLYHAPFSRKACDIFESIIEEALRKQPLYEKLCIYKILYLLTLLERKILYVNHPEKENFHHIARVVQHMNQSYDSNFSLEDYANMCTMSKYHFIRIFGKIVGCTPIQYRNNIRLQHAADLLLEEEFSVEQVSNMVGYSSASYFSSTFKQKYGLSPQEYKRTK